jgi:hypothetical protein
MLDNIVDDEEHKKACGFLYDSEKVFFLGFAFYPQNIDLLFPKKVERAVRDENRGVTYIKSSVYYGTFYKISSINRDEIISRVKERNERVSNFIGDDMKCVDFFRELSSVISFCK